MTDAARQLSGPLRDADAVLTAVRARQNELGLSNEGLEDLAGFCAGTVNKYLGPARDKMPGLSTLYLMLVAIGVGLVLVEDADAAERMRPRWKRRQGNHIQHAGRIAQTAITRAMPHAVHKLASSGGTAQWAGVSKRAKKAFIAKLNAARAAKRKHQAGMKEAA